jgi:hypothetical protein
VLKGEILAPKSQLVAQHLRIFQFWPDHDKRKYVSGNVTDYGRSNAQTDVVPKHTYLSLQRNADFTAKWIYETEQGGAVDNVEKAYEALLAKGTEFTAPPGKQPWGTSAVMKDSEGNTIVLASR